MGQISFANQELLEKIVGLISYIKNGEKRKKETTLDMEKIGNNRKQQEWDKN